MNDLHYESLGTVCARIKSGALSSVEVTRALLERIDTLDRSLHAYVMVLADSALEQARALDEVRASGAPLGTLHGVPIALKDLLFTQGFPTASGTRVMADFIPDQDGTLVALLKDAGAVIIGKTQLTEGAYGVHHPDILSPENPWDRSRWPGVSSSGSAVAVAAGLCYGAIGSDTGGSIRFPSASCATVGLKPTYGRVSRHGAFPLAPSLDHFGPMTRTVADAARMLQVMAGRDPQDPSSLDAPVPNYGAELGRSVEGMRIGIDWDYVSRGVEEPVVAAVRHAVNLLTDQGASIREIVMPDSHRGLVDRWAITCAVECAQAHRDYYPSQKDRYGPVLAELIELGLDPPEGAYQQLEDQRKSFREEFNSLFEAVDVVMSPCMPYLPPVADGVLELSADPDRTSGLTFTAPFDYSGHPTLSIPGGLSEERLPLSVQFIGPLLGESQLLRLGAAYEAALNFNDRPIP